MTNYHLMETQNLVISFDYSWYLAKNLAYAECPIMKFHYRNSSNVDSYAKIFLILYPLLENCTTGIAIVWRIDWYAERWLFLRLQLCIKEMHWNYTWLQLYSWSFDAFSSNFYNAWHLLIGCRWQSFRYFQLKLSKNIICTLSAYQSMHHIQVNLCQKDLFSRQLTQNIAYHC